MRDIKVVIGANWGDEGKGMLTDYFAAPHAEKAIVVRFNGGAQAGHTVVHENRRHIHRHIGSGSLVNARTYLSKHFVVHPMLFNKEMAELSTVPLVYVDPECYVTTPYDMWINQMLEQYRGDSKHGSCGVGFGETIERSEKSPAFLQARDLVKLGDVRKILDHIRIYWAPRRLEVLGMEGYGKTFLENDAVIENFIKDVEQFNELVHVRDISILEDTEHVIFEGAQGLMLDQDWGYFPNVTRSNTGLKNVVGLLKEMNHDTKANPVEVVYATRTYATRHGAGPFAHELSFVPYHGIEEHTNIPNQWQGDLRFGWLCLDQLKKSIEHDLEYADGLETHTSIAVTCMDQLDDGQVHYILNGKQHRAQHHAFLTALEFLYYPKAIYAGHGPTRETVQMKIYE